jgi:hypothetical protein
VDALPADKLIFYSEAHNLKQELELILKNSSLQPAGGSFSKSQIETFATNYLGLNFEKDVLSWMDGPYTFSVYRNEGSVIPGIVFIVDASASLEAARTFVSSIGSKISLAAAALSPQIPFLQDALYIGTVDAGDGSLSTLGFDFSKIPVSDLPVSIIPPSLLKESLSLYYGVLGNRFIFSTYREFPQVYEKGASLAASTKFQTFSQRLGGAQGEISYFDVDEALKFLESFITLVQDITAQGGVQSLGEVTEQTSSLQTPSFQTFVDEVRPYLSPLQGFLFQVTAKDYDFEIKGFVGVGAE